MAVLLRMNHAKAPAVDSTRALAESFNPLPDPPEELFLPDEPDFLPEVLPERPPREFRTTEDFLPFWTDPREKDAALWRDRVKAVIDELMERVP
jgi:predicted RecB family nuclease